MRREVERGAEVDAGALRTTKTDARYGQTDRTGLVANTILICWMCFYINTKSRFVSVYLGSTENNLRGKVEVLLKSVVSAQKAL